MLNINLKNDSDLDFLLFINHYNFSSINDYLSKYLSKEQIETAIKYYSWISHEGFSMNAINEIKNKEFYKIIYNEITKTAEYKNYLNETNEYRNKIINEFSNKKNFICSYLNTVFKEEINDSVDLYLVNPKFNQGSSNLKEKIAIFGSEKETFPGDINYALVYIVHESLHLLLPYDKYIDRNLGYEEYKEKQDLLHKIIEYIADRDLATILNGKEYNQHEELNYISEELYENYQKYLNSNEYNNIDEFIIDSLRRSFGIGGL